MVGAVHGGQIRILREKSCRFILSKSRNSNFRVWQFVFKVTRRASLSSKSNTGAGEIQTKRACQKVWYLAQKNEHFSKSMNSFGSGSIFPSSLGHYLSRNKSVVSVYAFWKNLSWRISFSMTSTF